MSVGQAAAATVYPAGGSSFTGGEEGWTLTAACNVPVPLLCSANATYDGTAGNPSGSLADKTEMALGLAGLVTAEAVETSPTFSVAENGAATLGLQRQFEVSELIALTSLAEYTVNLVDKTNGTKQKAFSETVEGASTFASKQGPVALAAGHSYAIEVDVTTKSSLANLGLFGNTTFHVDNVALTVSPPGGNENGNGSNGNNGGRGSNGTGGAGGNGGANGGAGSKGKNGANGSGNLSAAELRKLISSHGLVETARRHGNWIVLTGKCPKAIRRACTVRLRGMLTRRKAATVSRRAKIAKGARHQFIVSVRPGARHQVKGKRKILVKEWVRAGKTRVSVYKRLSLVGH